jgi:hypothetical protein
MQYAGDTVSEALHNTLEDVELPRLRWLADYWNAKRGNRPWPSRADLDPLEMRPVMGHIAILEVEPRPGGGLPVFKYRLFGSSFVHWFGFDMTGKTLDDWPAPEYRDYLNGSYNEVLQAQRPFRRYRRLLQDSRPLNYEGVMLPLGQPGRIEQIMAGQFFLV